MLRRAKHMGIEPNTIMYNTAMSALAKSGHATAAEMLFGDIPEPDSVSYETLIAAYGMAGEPGKAESVMTAMEGAGYSPRDYAYCGLIAAYRWTPGAISVYARALSVFLKQALCSQSPCSDTLVAEPTVCVKEHGSDL